MKKYIFTTIIMSIIGPWALGQTSFVTGTVYEDLNNDGKKNKTETGLGGVAVSNGEIIVQTDKNGRYRLPVGTDDIIFVVKPENYILPVDRNKLPFFYYIHKPLGSPDSLKYAGVRPTGDLPASVDFGLIKAPVKEEFSVLIFGDPQLYNADYIPVYEKAILNNIVDKKIDFGIVLGDMVVDNLSLLDPYVEVMKKTNIVWHHVLGNHDINMGKGVLADSLSDETFESIFGPATYSLNHGQAHFLILDNILYPDPRRDNPDHKFTYWHGFTDKHLKFIENDLKLVPKDKLIVIAMHSSLDGIPYSENDFNPEHKKKLFRMLEDFPNVLVLSGHSHIQRVLYHRSGNNSGLIHEYNVGTTSGGFYAGQISDKGLPDATMQDGTPQGFAYLRIKGNTYVLDYHVADPSKEKHMKLFVPKKIPFGKFSHSTAYVNFFMGDEFTKVDYRINDGEWKPMQHTLEADLQYLYELISWDLRGDLQKFPARRPYDALPSTHLWRTWFPRDLNEGNHNFEVRVTDRYGRKYKDNSTFFVEKQQKD